MKLTAQDIRHVALLARLELSEADSATCLEELGKILGFMEKLEELPTEGVPPTSAVGPASLPRRSDEPRPGIPREELLQGAPESREGHFRVPRVVE